jgi:hypothetical protein
VYVYDQECCEAVAILLDPEEEEMKQKFLTKARDQVICLAPSFSPTLSIFALALFFLLEYHSNWHIGLHADGSTDKHHLPCGTTSTVCVEVLTNIIYLAVQHQLSV